MARTVVIGAGGFGRETLDVLEASKGGGGQIAGVVDDAPSEANLRLINSRGIPYLGTIEQWLSQMRSAERYVIAVGDPHQRGDITDRIGERAEPAPPIIHPHATVGSAVRIGSGTVVCAGARVSTNVTIGLHVHVNPGAIIGHDATLSSLVSVNPGAIVSGSVHIGERTLVGAGATIIQNLTVGRDATIGAAACVTREVPHSVVAKGLPARW